MGDKQTTDGPVRLGSAAIGLGGLAFGIIQILQGTVSAFDPRPGASVMCALSVGLIGLTAERRRCHVRAAEGRDPVFATAIAASLASVLVLGWLVATGGFSRSIPPAIGVQIDDIRKHAADARNSTRFTFSDIPLHAGARSHVFVFSPKDHGSDELRIYDDVDGRLRQRFSFQPSTGGQRRAFRGSPPDQQATGKLDYWINQRPVVADLDGDGTREIIASYSIHSQFKQFGATIRLPLIFGWEDRVGAYVVSAMLSDRYALPHACRTFGRSVSARGPYILRDGRPDRQQRVTACAVSSTAILRPSHQADQRHVIVTATDVTRDSSLTRKLAVSLHRAERTIGSLGWRACALDPTLSIHWILRVRHENGSDYEKLLHSRGPILVQRARAAVALHQTLNACIPSFGGTDSVIGRGNPALSPP